MSYLIHPFPSDENKEHTFGFIVPSIDSSNYLLYFVDATRLLREAITRTLADADV